MKKQKNKRSWMLISLVLVITIVYNNIPVFAYAKEIPKSTHTYYSYNADTGEEVFHDGREYIPTTQKSQLTVMSSPEYDPFGDSSPLDLSALSESAVVPSAVIGSDNRVKVSNPKNSSTHRKIVCLTIMFDGYPPLMATGFLIGPNAVATAGHCVYDHTRNGWAKKITVSPARSGSENPYSITSSTSFEAGGDWVRNGSITDDWGIIKINKNFGIGWVGLRNQSSTYMGKGVTVAGYPWETEKYGSNIIDPYMFTHTSTVTGESGTRVLQYKNLDTSSGQSGAPVLSYFSDTGNTAIAIHRGQINYANAGVRIDQWLYNKLVSYR